MTNSRNAARGFTLVELLTVVAIIVLLVAVLVPAISAARRAAKNASTSATIGTLSTAIEAFRADQQIGGAYPPSASDNVALGRLTYKVNTPYPDNSGNPVPPASPARPLNLEISGAGLLVWALAGADLLGCPGFKPFRSQSDTWSYSTDAMPQTNTPDYGAYALNTQRNPARSRVGPLVDLGKVRISRWEQQAQTASTPGSYVIEAETEVARAIARAAPKRSYPMFLDGFGYPILYWRADAAGSQVCDRRPDDPEAATDKRGVFHYRDNGDLLSSNPAEIGPPQPAQTEPLMLNVNRAQTNTPHSLTFGPAYPPTNLHNPQTFEQQQRNHPFAAYVWNKDARSKVTPRKNDSFLLVSPGPDGIYGTGDDIANFDHNGAAIQ